jgi:hypothetical protein
MRWGKSLGLWVVWVRALFGLGFFWLVVCVVSIFAKMVDIVIQLVSFNCWGFLVRLYCSLLGGWVFCFVYDFFCARLAVLGAWDVLALLWFALFCFGSGLPALDFCCMERLGWQCVDTSILHLVA